MVREEQKNFERDVINRCRDKPILFFRYVNNKMEARKIIEKITVDEVVYENARI